LPGSDEVAQQEAAEKARRRKRTAIISVIAGLLVVLLAVFAILQIRDKDEPSAPTSNSPSAETTTVPKLPESRSIDDAIKALEKVRLKPEKAVETSDTVPKDQVIRFDPESGQSVQAGSTVKYVVSAGKEAVIVPDVKGMTQEAARKALEDKKLKVAEVVPVDSPDVPENNVVGTDPPVDTPLEAGDTVKLQISSGRFQVPDCTGKTQSECSDELGKAGMRIGNSSEEESDEKAGTVIRTSPEKGRTEKQGTAVDVVIAKAKPMITLKDFAGTSWDEAKGWLEAQELKAIQKTEASSSVEAGKVIRTEPAAGSSVAKGSEVTVVVSTGSGAPPSPDPSP
jgi:serine/threonine-protein kinase